MEAFLTSLDHEITPSCIRRPSPRPRKTAISLFFGFALVLLAIDVLLLSNTVGFAETLPPPFNSLGFISSVRK
nr:hypothetical protein SHINE37_41290 [Rhizobiaceae bacterium]